MIALNFKKVFVIGILYLLSIANIYGQKAQPVVITENNVTATLSNGQVALVIIKANGNILSLKYKGMELMSHGEGYWVTLGEISHKPAIQAVSTPSVFSITKDPTQNKGDIGEMSVRFPYHGQEDVLPLDIEIRYTLHRNDSGIYGWTILNHHANYPAVDVPLSDFTMKLNPDVFDFLSIDSARQKLMPTSEEWVNGTELNMKEARRINSGPHAGEVEHKYDYNMLLSRVAAYGWSSTKKNVGLFIVNPSIEYLNGGPVMVDYQAHIDVKPKLPADPTLLFDWHTPHYGGKKIEIKASDNWQKIVGPFLIYANQRANAHNMWQDALARAEKEKKAWPYTWADAEGYAHADERGKATGKLQVQDPQSPKASAAGAWIGLAHAPYQVNLNGVPTILDWQLDGKYYQYWARVDAKGNFTIPNARPGTYVLYAFNNGILGDYSKVDVTIQAGKTTQLGTLKWVPERYGKQLWEIGIPNRSAEEFRHGDHYWQWGLNLLYPKEFPNDVDYIIGKSDYHQDWNYAQPGKALANGRYVGPTWKIEFNMPSKKMGTATLRLAICGSYGPAPLNIKLNGTAIGTTGRLMESSVMHRDGIRSEALILRDIKFNANLLQPGNNVIELSKGANTQSDVIMYDYLRLELDEGKDFVK
jgi:rhamnogalacturonan endolyase